MNRAFVSFFALFFSLKETDFALLKSVSCSLNLDLFNFECEVRMKYTQNTLFSQVPLDWTEHLAGPQLGHLQRC